MSDQLISLGNMSDTGESPKKKRKSWYTQSFNDKWLQREDFKDWLRRDNNNSYCMCCSVTLKNAGISMLSSHRNTKKHKKNFEVVKSKNEIITNAEELLAGYKYNITVGCEKCNKYHDSIQTYVECTGQMVSQEAIIEPTEDEKGKLPFLWTHEATLFLLEKVKNKWPRLSGGKERKSFIWKEITNEMQSKIPDIIQSNIEFKWKNLRAKHIQYETSQKSDQPLKKRSPYSGKIAEIIDGCNQSNCLNIKDESWIMECASSPSIVLQQSEDDSDTDHQYISKTKKRKFNVSTHGQHELAASIGKLTEEVQMSNRLLAQHFKATETAEEQSRKNEERMIHLLEIKNDLFRKFIEKKSSVPFEQ